MEDVRSQKANRFLLLAVRPFIYVCVPSVKTLAIQKFAICRQLVLAEKNMVFGALEGLINHFAAIISELVSLIPDLPWKDNRPKPVGW